ncbi:MAG: FG-GAP-like repeat-containing protein [Planctomycetota bacterium]
MPDEAFARGLVHIDRCGGPEKRTILEANGGGVALLDLGPDGDLDVVFTQGLGSLEALTAGPGADLEVYLNDGAGRFTRAAGPGLSGWWTGLAAGDIDGDGDADLIAGGFGALTVLLQVDGRLVPSTELCAPGARLTPGRPRAGPTAASAAQPPDWFTSLALADFDGDGALDLYAGRYLEFDPADPPLGALGEGPLAVPCTWRGMPVYCGPRGLTPQPDALFFGGNDGTFRAVSATHLTAHVPAYTLGVQALDADADGDVDLCVANDSAPNLLLVNDGTGRFTDFGYAAGVALGPDGQKEAGMGIAAGDVDGDGRLDLVLTNFSEEPTRLLLGADVGFRDATHRAGLGRESRALLSWGAHLVDLDGDGRLELFTANGHVHPVADAPHTGTGYGQRDSLWRIGNGRVEALAPVTERSLLFARSASRGSALGDVDGDGRPDLVVSRIDGPAALGMNRFEGKRWLELRLTGDASPRDGSGARVTLTVNGTTQLREVTTSGSFQSSSSPWVSFGLDRAETYDALTVRWPSGRVESLGAGASGRRLFVHEGEGIVASEVLRAADPASSPELALGAPAAQNEAQDEAQREAQKETQKGAPNEASNAAPSPTAGLSALTPKSSAPRTTAKARAAWTPSERAQLLEEWSAALAASDVAELVTEGAPLVAPGGALEGDSEAVALVARGLHAAGDVAGARRLLAAARARDDAAPDLEWTLAEAAIALAEDDLEGALELVGLRAAPAASNAPAASAAAVTLAFPEAPLAWLVAGRALARRAEGGEPRSEGGRAAEGALDRERADRCLTRFVELAPLHPDAPSALHLLARHALARRDAAGATALRAEADRRARWHEVFRARSNAKRRAPLAAEPRLALAELWRAVGRSDRARAELEALLALDPTHSEARARLAALGR